MTIKKIIVTGPVLSGKQTLLHLLDGHPSIGVNLIHDQLLISFLHLSLKSKKSSTEELHCNDISNYTDKLLEFKSTNKKIQISLFKCLEALKQSNLVSVERYAFLKIIPNFYSVKKKEFHTFNFDYMKFQNEWKNKIFNNKETTTLYAEDFFDEFLKSFFLAWDEFDHTNIENKHIAFKAPNNSEYSKFILDEKFNGKIVYVSRDIVGLIKSRAINEQIRHKDLGKNLDEIFSYMASSSFIDKMKDELKHIKKLQKDNPNKIYITSLESLVHRTKNEMQKILEFLNIEENEICFFPTYIGKKIVSNHIASINDDDVTIDDKLTNFAKLRFYGFKFFKKNYKNIYLLDYYKLLLFWIKKTIKSIIQKKIKKTLFKFKYENKKS